MAASEVLERTSQVDRREMIVSALAEAIGRQRQSDRAASLASATELAPGTVFFEGMLDLHLLAGALERVLDGLPGVPAGTPLEEGKSPQELNATNDD